MDYVSIGLGLVFGLGIGYGLARALADRNEPPAPAEPQNSQPNWWKIRQSLTGTQLQILQFMESEKDVSITGLQDKFSFIPDRELFYRLEQIVLMQFLVRERRDGEVHYVLNPDYSVTVEDDKTVMLSSG